MSYERRTLMLFGGLFSIFTTMIIGRVPIGFILLITSFLIIAEFSFRYFSSSTMLPYALMITAPVSLICYSTTSDFMIRFTIFILMIYIFTAPLIPENKRRHIPDLKEKPLLIWIIPLFLFISLSVWLDHKGVQLSGDEPHYLMVTQSLVEDHDLSLKNNVEQRTYLEFIPTDLPAHMIIHKGKHLSFHMPGLSFVLIPFYIIFNAFGDIISPQLFFRISISIINSFFPLILFYLLGYFFPGKNVTGVWLISIMSVPFLFHSVHIFPELPAATLLAGSFLFLFRKSGSPAIAGSLFSLTIWFHVKYYPPLILFALFAIWYIYKKHSKMDLFKFLIFPFFSSVILLIFSKAVYGTFNPAGIFPAESYWSTPLILKIKVFLAYFIDQRDGLLLYAPTMFFFIFGLKLRKTSWKIPVALTAIYTFFHAITTVRGAHAPAGRPLIFILWIIILFMCNHYFRSEKKYLFRIMTGINLFILFWILQYPQFVYQPVFSSTSDGSSSFLKFMGSNTLDLSKFFPSFLTNRGYPYITDLIWIAILVLAILAFYSGRSGSISVSNRKIKYISTGMFFLSVLFLSIFPHVNISAKDHFKRGGISMFNTSSNFVWVDNKQMFRIKSGEEYTIYFEERKWKKNILFHFDIPENSSLIVENAKDLIFRGNKISKAEFNIDLSGMNKFRSMKKDLIPVWIKTGSTQQNKFFFLRMDAK